MNKYLSGCAVILFMFLSSCASREKLVYLYDQPGGTESAISNHYEPILQPDDVLSIVVSSASPELVNTFNPGISTYQSLTERSGGQQRMQTYLIDKEGDIIFPIIGKLKLGGLTTAEATQTVTTALKPHVADATVNLRIFNFKVTVQGEVVRPGTFTIDSERITLLQALSMAGDPTIYGKRDDILIIRELDGKRTYSRVDITKPDFLNSEFYYLMQNDVVYIEPNNVRVNSSAVGPNLTFALSAISLLTTIVVVILNNN